MWERASDVLTYNSHLLKELSSNNPVIDQVRDFFVANKHKAGEGASGKVYRANISGEQTANKKRPVAMKLLSMQDPLTKCGYVHANDSKKKKRNKLIQQEVNFYSIITDEASKSLDEECSAIGLKDLPFHFWKLNAKTLNIIFFMHLFKAIEKQELKEKIFVDYTKPGKELSDKDIIRILRIAKQLVHQLNVMREHNIIHRDIAPKNIIFHRGKYTNCKESKNNFADKDEDIKAAICDFTLAKIICEGEAFALGDVAGTADYVAPDMTIGAMSYRSDLLNIVRVILAMLYGEETIKNSGNSIPARILNSQFMPGHLSDLSKKMLKNFSSENNYSQPRERIFSDLNKAIQKVIDNFMRYSWVPGMPLAEEYKAADFEAGITKILDFAEQNLAA